MSDEAVWGCGPDGTPAVRIHLLDEEWPFKVIQRFGDVICCRRYCTRGTALAAYVDAVDNADQVVRAVRYPEVIFA